LYSIMREKLHMVTEMAQGNRMALRWLMINMCR
jgi:hypothetical protein